MYSSRFASAARLTTTHLRSSGTLRAMCHSTSAGVFGSLADCGVSSIGGAGGRSNCARRTDVSRVTLRRRVALRSCGGRVVAPCVPRVLRAARRVRLSRVRVAARERSRVHRLMTRPVSRARGGESGSAALRSKSTHYFLVSLSLTSRAPSGRARISNNSLNNMKLHIASIQAMLSNRTSRSRACALPRKCA